MLDAGAAETADIARSEHPHDGLPGILHICTNTVLGGTERGTLNTMRLMATHGYRSVLACHAEGEQFAEATRRGLKAVPCRFEWMQRTTAPGKLLRYATSLQRESRRLLHVCREHGIDILVPHGHVAALYARRAAKELGLPLIFHVHDARAASGFSLLAQRYFTPSVTRAVCISHVTARVLVSSGFPEDRVQVIYNALNNPAYLGSLPEPTPEVMGPGPHFGLVGVIVPFKGQKVFLQAAERILQHHPTAQFYVVGPLCHPDHQDYLDEIQAMAERPPLKGHVTFTGQRNDVPNWTVAMDALTMPSMIPEALGNTALEAMALGRRVVATNHGGPLEFIRDGETGRLVPPGDPVALAEALMDLASRRDDDPMGQLAMQDIRARFGPERFALEMADLYAELLSARVRDQRPG